MITIDKEFQSLIPPLTADEYTQLEKNILKDGIRDPLVVWKPPDGTEVLVDGHNRMRIAEAHPGITYKVEYMKFDSRDDVIAWIIMNQFGRRNLSAYDRSVLALKLKPVIVERAKEQQASHSEQGYQKSDKAVHTAKELAKAAGVSHDTIHKVEVIENYPDKSMRQMIRSGDISINQAYRAIREREVKKLPNARQFEEMARERHEAVETAKTVSIAEAKQDKLDRKTLEDAARNRVAKATGAIDLIYILANEGELNIDLMSENTKKTVLSAIAGAISKLKAIQTLIEGK